jgi:hypothetical protein
MGIFAGQGKGDGPEEEQADLEKDGNTNDKRRDHHGVVGAFRAKDPDDPRGDDIGAAGFREHFSEHRAEADDHGELSHGMGDAVGEGIHDLARLHARGQAEDERNNGNGDDRVDLATRDEEDERNDGHGRDQQERIRGENR